MWEGIGRGRYMEEVTYLNISANTENKAVRQNIVFMKRNINNPDIYIFNVDKTIGLLYKTVKPWVWDNLKSKFSILIAFSLNVGTWGFSPALFI